MTRSIKFLFAALIAGMFLGAPVQAQDKAPKAADPPKAVEPEHKNGQPKADGPKAEKKEEKAASEGDGSEYEYAKIATSKGDIYVRLNKTKAPISTKNFLEYADKKFYDNTIFHRVVKEFVVQGGGFTTELKEKETSAPIKNEWKNGLKNKKGTIAMARVAAADSATSQFYINVQDNEALDYPREAGDNAAYAVFGNVVAGMKVVDQIRQVRTTTKNGSRPDGKPIPLHDCPAENVVIKSIARVSKDEAEKAAESDK
ncbi:MAG TPA: peptidylprolyl isomerase [Phycisphaerales bacterium]|nr:peptidylprolyl isomerase [Phycisphaerales bacterium]